ncbi:hypothetical protein ASPTUDRAFT_26063 [Aspergillus tubingensis CBS 134.48]|uniref:Uncharacterized protein n=1 Tax=Aspergillus tubingensis (strain CBS 134.48) TaxID=767770 RepID=A0A1L9NMK5_ASPTC|nr:hypothetical protein ASPTUDRAFT_26063 [Aspergillus tubingensis CBS 134.48]
MANNWREKAALAVNAQVASTHQEPFPPPPCRASLAGRADGSAKATEPRRVDSPLPKVACRLSAPSLKLMRLLTSRPTNQKLLAGVVVANHLLRAAHGRSRANFNPVECSAASWQPHPSARMYDTQ